MNSPTSTLLPRLDAALLDLDPDSSSHEKLRQLIAARLDRLPQPGGGETLSRWRALAAVAEHDLSLAKLYEGHTDALAILDEINAGLFRPDTGAWGVWASESPAGRVVASKDPDGRVRLNGLKCWCSGAGHGSHAMLTAWHANGEGPQLVAVALNQPGITVQREAWQAVGMRGSKSFDVHFAGAVAQPVGSPGDYLSRPGFWHGGAGIAACWFGGAVGIARALRQSIKVPVASDALRLAALGKVDIALRQSRALLVEAAAWIDANPRADAKEVALRVRLASEQCAQIVLTEAGRVLGAGAYCRDHHFAQAAADLPVFIRQSHGDRDCAALAEHLAPDGYVSWTL